MNILRTNSVLFVAGVGLTFVIVGQGLDLSIGSLVALGGVFLASMLAKGVPVELAIILTIICCGALGAIINGGLIAYGGFNFFVVTLATLQLFRGAALVLSSGRAMSTANFDLVQFLGDGRVGPVPVPVAIAVLVGIIGYVVMRWTSFWPRRLRRRRQRGSRASRRRRCSRHSFRGVRHFRAVRRYRRRHAHRPPDDIAADERRDGA